MKFRLTLTLLFISILTFAQEINHVQIPGTTFYMIPPADFKIAEGFKGFLHESSGALIMVNELEVPYALILGRFSKEALEKKEMTLVGTQELKVNNTDATLITATQPENGIENYKKMLLFGEGYKTLLVTAVYPESNPELGAGIKRALLSTIYKRPVNSEPRIPNFESDQETFLEHADIYQRKSMVDGHWIIESFYNSGERQMIATYSDDALKIKEGLVKRWYKSGQLADSNFYVNGKLEGYQTWFFGNGQRSEEGTYVAGEPKSVILRTEDGLSDPNGFSGVRPPSFKGEGFELQNYLVNTLKYPDNARGRNQEGKSVIRFEITAQGKITEARVFRSSGVPALDNEALRVIRLMPDWNAPSDHNRRTKVTFTMPITFRLD